MEAEAGGVYIFRGSLPSSYGKVNRTFQAQAGLMQKHTDIYMKYFDYGTPEEIPCEACTRIPISDVHHIHGRGDDSITNLMGLCRKCHERAHGTKNYVSKDEFQYIHNNFLQGQRKCFLK